MSMVGLWFVVFGEFDKYGDYVDYYYCVDLGVMGFW